MSFLRALRARETNTSLEKRLATNSIELELERSHFHRLAEKTDSKIANASSISSAKNAETQSRNLQENGNFDDRIDRDFDRCDHEITHKISLERWVEQDSLKRFTASYCELVPNPRSTIANAYSPCGKFVASTQCVSCF